MRRICVTLALLSAVALASAAPAHGWGSATHAYIGHELRASAGPVDLDEIYGSMAPDLFNFLFLTRHQPYYAYLYGLSHDDGVALRSELRRGWEKAALYGFLGHNDLWGSDQTAHHASRTLEDNDGYIVTKAAALHEILMSNPAYAGLGLPTAVSLEICHNLVEAAGDLIIAEAQPRVGEWMAAAAARPAQPLRGLLTRAWTDRLVEYALSVGKPLTAGEAALVVVESEEAFRARVMLLGALLQQPAAAAFDGVVGDFASLAAAFLGSLGVTLPPGVDLEPLIRFGIGQGQVLCATDYLAEIEATVGFTELNLRRHRALRRLR